MDKDCYWTWETRNDKNLAEAIERRVKFMENKEFIGKLNSLKGEVMSFDENIKELTMRRIESLINDLQQR